MYTLEAPIKTFSKSYEKKIIRVDMSKEVADRMRRLLDKYCKEWGRRMFDVQTAQQLSHKLWVLTYQATFNEYQCRHEGRPYLATTFTCMTPSWIRFAKEAIAEKMKDWPSDELQEMLNVLNNGKEVKSC